MKVWVLVSVSGDDPDAVPELFTEEELAVRAATELARTLWVGWFGRSGKPFPENWEEAMGHLYEQSGFYDSVVLTNHDVKVPKDTYELVANPHRDTLIGCERCGKPSSTEVDGEVLCTDCAMAADDGTLYEADDGEADDYTVIITRDTTESTTLHVRAKDSTEASALALEKLAQIEFPVWEQDDAVGGDPYVTDTSLTNPPM